MEEIKEGDEVTHPSEPGRIGTVETVEFDRRYKQSVYLVQWPGCPWPVPYRSGLAKVLDLDAMEPLELVRVVQRELAKLREAATDDRPHESLNASERVILACLDSACNALKVAERKLHGPKRRRCPGCGRPIAVKQGAFAYHGMPGTNRICPGWGTPVNPAEESSEAGAS
ncbi:hypothetical protein [Streptomyces demainii]|uniref:DUF1918 domain-containing protein n=1 Tax=Streptomyces demainii TaxID=588122 RepID=A0ABT9KT01_9ACTN|nr:hypothetical protein [Streptomyces demainii]MDP9611565.1 hypothetical protein [Streptomyces demainii]